MTETKLFEAAAAGDEAAFAELVTPHRRLLHAHCYRMLGSTQDAEDAVQEALLRAWRNLGSFQGRSSLRSWLYTIATNACLRAIERRPARVLPVDYGPPAGPDQPLREPLIESTWIEPYPDALLGPEASLAGPDARYELRESIELAFVAALQHLPARQRAVLILRDVLGFSGAEVAAALQTTPAAVYSALQRAHQTIDARLPERSQQVALASLDDAHLRGIVDRYVRAWERDDVEALAALLTDGAILAMPPTPSWYRGRQAVADALRAGPLSGANRWHLTPTPANGQLAVTARDLGDPGGDRVHHIAVLTLRGALVHQIDAFHAPLVHAVRR